MSGRVDTRMAPVAPTNVSRSGINTSTQTPKPRTANPLSQAVANQPLPVANTPQYNETQALYAKALADLQANSQAMLAMQAQMNRMSATDPTAGLMQRMMAMYQGDPFADLRAQANQLNQAPQRFSTSWMGFGY